MKLAAMLVIACLPVAAAGGKGSILAVFAHPDDETTVGALLAKYAAAGHDVHLVSITSGQKGTTPNTKLSGDELGAARDEELLCSTNSLGIHPPILLHYQDQGISAPPVMQQIAGRLRDIIEKTKPQVLITWGAEGVTGHPDHRVASNLTTEVFQQRSLLKHRPRKLYYLTFPESNFARAPQTRRMPFRTVSDAFITTVVDVTSTLDAAAKSVNCHKTQWDAARMKEMDLMNREILQGRVFLRLAMSDVPLPAGRREADIFEGIDLVARADSPSVRAEHCANRKESLIQGGLFSGACRREVPNAARIFEAIRGETI
jgi:LmbE family N-acetylglucosaminyl deacetylase